MFFNLEFLQFLYDLQIFVCYGMIVLALSSFCLLAQYFFQNNLNFFYFTYTVYPVLNSHLWGKLKDKRSSVKPSESLAHWSLA
jgi:hypothetical protein